MPQRAVSRILSAVAAASRPRLWRDDHSSSPVITDGIKQPTRKPRTGRPMIACCQANAPPYLALLRAGFCLPRLLPDARCALTAPFHPCLFAAGGKAGNARQRCVFCATFLRVAPTGRYPAHCPAEFGLSSRPPSSAFALSDYGETTRDRRSSSALRPLYYPTFARERATAG